MNTYHRIIPEEQPLSRLHGYLLSTIGPRPIALASTLDKEDRPNLAPFSYFNVFSTAPPLLIFSPNRSGASGQHKDTVLNILETFEVVINVVNFAIVQQSNVASAEFDHNTDEFLKSGLTPLPSELVKPFRVAESPVQLECKVREVITLGSGGGSGNLVLCELVLMHIHSDYLDENQKVRVADLDMVARFGGPWYVRANEDSMFSLPKPAGKVLGIDQLPPFIRNSDILTGNDLGQLATLPEFPAAEALETFIQTEQNQLLRNIQTPIAAHEYAQSLLRAGDAQKALLLLLAYEEIQHSG